MFELFYKDKQKFVRVYAVRDDKNGYPHFLIYDALAQWQYISAKHFSNKADWENE